MFFIIQLAEFIGFVVPLLVSIAVLTLLERKILALMQRRRGPNVVGFFGILQPFADGIKLVLKESILPIRADTASFIGSPILIITTSFINWAYISWFDLFSFVNFEYSILLFFAISSLGTYGILISGWASNNKYAFLGAIRTAAQYISYEITLGLVLLTVALLCNSFNFIHVLLFQQQGWLFFLLFPICLIFFISILAETNRLPFDLPEAESELVSGYNVEYSAITFAFFFLGEYSNMILMSAVFVILFFGGGYPPLSFLGFVPTVFWFSIKIFLVLFTFVWLRATLPRYRYDQLMTLSWLKLIPVAFGFLFFVLGITAII